MSESKPKVKVEDVPAYEMIHVWYSQLEKAIIVSLSKAKWTVDVEPNGDHVHIYKRDVEK